VDLKTLICAALTILIFSIPPAAAEAHVESVGCGAVIDTPGNYQLSGNLTCHVGVPPFLFCDKAAITITAPNVQLDGQGFTLAGYIGQGIGIQITASHVQVRNITTELFATGIEIKEGRFNHLEAVNLHGASALYCPEAGGTGLRLTNTTDNHVTKSNISGNENWGVRLISSSGNHLNGNQILNNRSGSLDLTGNIDLLSSHQNRISGNDLSGGGFVGVRVEESNGNVIIGNKVKETGSIGGNGIGIWLSASSENLIALNLVDRQPIHGFDHRGIAVDGGATRNVIVGNVVLNQQPGFGIKLFQGANGNLILGNRAMGNTPWDAQDDNTRCDANIWTANQFGTVNQSCIR